VELLLDNGADMMARTVDYMFSGQGVGRPQVFFSFL
jgi:hypothetical protein